MLFKKNIVKKTSRFTLAKVLNKGLKKCYTVFAKSADVPSDMAHDELSINNEDTDDNNNDYYRQYQKERIWVKKDVSTEKKISADLLGGSCLMLSIH